jgi:C-terminal processing protease CtpA/Prc
MYTSGEMMGFRYALLTKRFPVLLRIIFGIEPPYKVVIKHNSELYEHLLEGGKAKEVLAQIKAISQKEYSFEIKDSTGILTIPSFSLYKEDATRFKEFIDGVFLRLRESSAEHLIIDVRNNGGGDSRLSQYTADYLTEKPLKGFDRLIWKSSRQIREYVLDDITNNTNGFYNQCSYDYLTSVPEGESLHYPIEMSENPNKHKENTFHGKVLVLTNSLCFSSTVSFLTMIRDYKLGTIIGTTPGGLPNHFGDCYSFRLPHTDISCSVSQKKFVRSSGDETDNDLTPDFIIEQSPEDTQKNIDTVMEFSKNFQ